VGLKPKRSRRPDTCCRGHYQPRRRSRRLKSGREKQLREVDTLHPLAGAKNGNSRLHCRGLRVAQTGRETLNPRRCRDRLLLDCLGLVLKLECRGPSPGCASPGILDPSRAEERAIVHRMSNENTKVKCFFTGYEAANAIFDVEQIAACYAEAFMFGGPEGVQCVKKEDFLKLLPRRKEFFRSRGLVSSNIDSLAASTLDSKYTLVKVVWNMRFDRSASEPVYSQNTASYILSGTNDRFQIVFQIDHQDLTKRVQELGME
jgi:hypothetical protein